MSLETQTAANPKWMLWTGRVLTTLIVLFMLVDGGFKIIKHPKVVEASTQLGYPENTILWIGLAATVSALLYAIPQTTVLGAILLTGFLGGAAATHVRVGESNYFFAIFFGVLAWLGVYLRDPRLRKLVPLRQ
jgi:hypothetical protein